MYDVIVVGARIAGSSTALLLARRGLRVLCLDQASFPSETFSNHQIDVAGIARLKRWGLLDAIIATGAPAYNELKFDSGKVVLQGRFPPLEGVDAQYGPPRTILDKMLVDCARESGVELREDVVVEGLTFADRCVNGVRARTKSGRTVVETAPLIVGADGKHSIVARAVSAATYFEKPILSAAYYAYWEGLQLNGGEAYARPRRTIGVWPTNDGLTDIYLAIPIADHAAFRSDVAGNFMKALDGAGELGARVRAARHVGRFRGSGYLPNRFRKPHGPGWALVGDAGLVMDPITGLGMSYAFRDAELLADAIEAGLGGRRNLDQALRAYEKERNRQSLPGYKLTIQQAELAPPTPEFEVLCELVQGRQTEIDRLLGVLAGSTPIREYMSPVNLLRVLGPRGIAMVARRRIFGSPQPKK